MPTVITSVSPAQRLSRAFNHVGQNSMKTTASGGSVLRGHQHRKASIVAGPARTIEAEPSTFVPVVAIASASPPAASPTESLPVRRESPSMSAPPQARLSVRLPNGVAIDLECSVQDAPLVKAMIVALGAG
ncbi:hypothetical protein LGM90_29345 [Burkholderia sp. AU28942]|nr:hypothetical protein [Burkholderia latens]AOK05996.1 hypothetical protein WK25_15610 [Burkholderia latens]MCA8312613.1 hypothetical protein [Burkholderia sp. AU28942]